MGSFKGAASPPRSSVIALGREFYTWKCVIMHLSPESLSCPQQCEAEELMIAQRIKRAAHAARAILKRMACLRQWEI